MGYCEEFQLLIQSQDFSNFLHLWEEYCLADEVDGEELLVVLGIVKNSNIAPTFGKYAETILPLWKQIQNEKVQEEVLKMAIDLQTTNSPLFADLAFEHLKKKYSHLKEFNDKIRMVGLRSRKNFQGAISNFDLLVHMKKGNFVFHTGGWGVGEIMEASLIREHALIEFEGISALKDLSFESAFKNLIPLPSDHFLARRFGAPDALEKEGRDDPLQLIHILLRDLGPKNAVEIKEELCDLVIPEKDWTKWWQQARAKIKKDTQIKSPESTKAPFELRKVEVSHETSFRAALAKIASVPALIQTIYNHLRDFPEVFKNKELKEDLHHRLHAALEEIQGDKAPQMALRVQIYFLLEDLSLPKSEKEKGAVEIITSCSAPESILQLIDIVAFKKRFLMVLRKERKDFQTIFLHLFFLVSPNMLRDYVFKELQGAEMRPLLLEKLKELLNRVTVHPEAFFWYFQKIVTEEGLPLGDKESQQQFLEAFFILIHYIEDKAEFRDLLKKMQNLLSAKRYLVFREVIQGASIEYLQELLLIASKCHSIEKAELRVLHSLAEVVQPQLKLDKKETAVKAEEVLWATAEGYRKVQERLQHIGTVETVDNAREIEAARALGDLRENSEYKFALERRARLQGELKTLSQQLQKARILTKEDIEADKVGVGTIVGLSDSKGNKVEYTLLGPWEANPEERILSIQSKLAIAMAGCEVGDTFTFQGEKFTVKSIKSYL